MSLLDTQRNEMLRQRFGVLAHHKCRDLSGCSDEAQRRRQQASQSVYDMHRSTSGMSPFMFAAFMWMGMPGPLVH